MLLEQRPHLPVISDMIKEAAQGSCSQLTPLSRRCSASCYKYSLHKHPSNSTSLEASISPTADHSTVTMQVGVHLNLNVDRLTAGTTQRLVNHDAGIGHGGALALGTSAQQEGSH